jgi:hypothetical protein
MYYMFVLHAMLPDPRIAAVSEGKSNEYRLLITGHTRERPAHGTITGKPMPDK